MQTKSEEIMERYRQSKTRRKRRDNFIFMLFGLAGTVVTGLAFLFFLTQGVISLTFLSLVGLSFMAFIFGLIGWIRGDQSVNRFFGDFD
jgi:hypothetical protein